VTDLLSPKFSATKNLNVTFYQRNLPHLQRDFKPHFITFVTKHREILPAWARDVVLASCVHDAGTRYTLHVAVVMPDHVHLILTPEIDSARQEVYPLHSIMRGIKGASAWQINRLSGKHGHVWQEESFDHVLRSSESLDAKIQYVMENPLRRGLVSNSGEYRWLWRRQ